jgi:hypothetical protein
MQQCPFFKEQKVYFQSNERSTHQQSTPGSKVVYRWCAHPKHSPAPEKEVKFAIGGANRLQCGGNFAHCEVPADLFGDVA